MQTHSRKNQMVVLITGANGFVGQFLVEYLAKNNCKVFAFTRSGIDAVLAKKWEKHNVKHIIARLDKLKNIKKTIGNLVPKDSVLFHLAWEGLGSLTGGDLSHQIKNVEYASNIVDLAKDLNCKKIINIGSAQEDFIEKELISPSSSTQTNYALAKIGVRDILNLRCYIEKIDFIHVRISVPIDPSLHKGGYITKCLEQISNNCDVAEPKNKQSFDFISMPELCKALCILGNRGEDKKNYYIGLGKFTTLKNHFERYKAAVEGKNFPIDYDVDILKIFNKQDFEKDFQFKFTHDICNIHLER